MKIKTIIITLIFNGIFHSGFAQVSNLDRTNPTSPQSATLIDEVKIPVNFYHGTPDIEVPLYTISEGSGLDLTLKYDASGLKLAKLCGWVGLNWQLNAGGIITRIKRGKTIDEHYDGFARSDQLNGQQLNDAVWSTVTGNPNTASSDVMLYFLKANQYYDSEPDLFYFAFGKYHGQFRFKRDGSIISDDPSMKIHPQYQYFGQNNTNAYIIGWAITAGDGTIFEFTKNEYYLGSMSYIDANGGSSLSLLLPVHYYTSWYLTKISTTNNRTIDFFYNATTFNQLSDNTDEYFVKDPSSSLDCNYVKNSSNNKYTQFYLDSIKTDSKVICFESDETIEYVTKKLSRIKIFAKENHSLIQKISFTYNNLGCTDCWGPGSENIRFLLQAINKVSPNGSTQLVRSFIYDTTPVTSFNPTLDGFYSTAGMDHWGYYNGPQTSNYYSLIPPDSSGNPFFYRQNYVDYSGIPSRVPNLSYTKAGVLTEIKYPTGGSIVFNYELNDYSYVNNTIVKSGKIAAGGLRIQSITYKYGNGNPDVVKSYSYLTKYNSSLSSGVIDNEPTYEFSFNLNNFYPSTPNYSSKSSQPLYPISIGYSRVIEQVSGVGKTIYEYTTSRNYPYQQNQNQFCYYLLRSPYLTSGFIKTSHPFNSLLDNDEFKRGLLTNKYQYDNNGSIVERDSTNYTFKTYSGNNEFSLRWIEFPAPTKIDNICFLNLYPSNIGVALINEDINFINGSTTAFKKTQYVYNGYNLLSQVKSYQSDGLLIATEHKYSNDYYQGSAPTYNGDAYKLKLMVDRNMINEPVEKTTLKNNLITSSELTLFDLKNNIIVPKEVYYLEFATPYSKPSAGLSYTTLSSNQVSFNKSIDYKLSEQYQEYNSVGNLLQKTGRDGVAVSNLWDATGNYLMAQVKGVTYSQISSQDGKSSTYLSKTLWTSLNNLVSNGVITTYSYKPLIGLTEQTDPTGVTVYYPYDSMGRLEFIKNDDQNLLKKYVYHYYNQ